MILPIYRIIHNKHSPFNSQAEVYVAILCYGDNYNLEVNPLDKCHKRYVLTVIDSNVFHFRNVSDNYFTNVRSCYDLVFVLY